MNRNHLRRYLLPLVIAVFVFPSSAFAQNEAVATVNGEAITRQALMDRLLAEFGKGLVEDMIDELIVLQEARKLNIEVTDEEIDKKVEEQKAAHGTARSFEAWLKERKLTPQSFRERMRTIVRLEKIVTPTINIPEENVALLYIDKPELFNEPAQVRIRGIFKKQRKLAEQVQQLARDRPTQFDKMAQQFSDHESRATGGELGWKPLEAMERLGLSAEKGKISEVIAGDDGYWVYQVVDFQPAKRKPFKEAAPSVRKYLFEERLASAIVQRFAELKEKAKIERNLSK